MVRVLLLTASSADSEILSGTFFSWQLIKRLSFALIADLGLTGGENYFVNWMSTQLRL